MVQQTNKPKSKQVDQKLLKWTHTHSFVVIFQNLEQELTALRQDVDAVRESAMAVLSGGTDVQPASGTTAEDRKMLVEAELNKLNTRLEDVSQQVKVGNLL